jgi:hypothetical protein
MKLLEKLLYSSLLFLFVYIILSLALRLFELTSVYTSHLVGGVAATVLGMVFFMYLLLKKKDKK